MFLHTWAYQLIPSLHSNCRGQYTCLHFYRLYTSEISFPLFFFPLLQTSKQRGKTLAQEIIEQWPRRSLFYTLLQGRLNIVLNNGEKTLSNYSPVIMLALQEVCPSPISLNMDLPVQISKPRSKIHKHTLSICRHKVKQEALLQSYDWVVNTRNGTSVMV